METRAKIENGKKVPTGYIIGNSCSLVTKDDSFFSLQMIKTTGDLYEQFLSEKSRVMLLTSSEELREKDLCNKGKKCEKCQDYLNAVEKLNMGN